MKLYDIEFYSAPGGEVLVKNKIKPVYELTTKHRDFITSFLEKVEKKHPLAHQRLCFNCK